jgi:hypothetical protein
MGAKYVVKAIVKEVMPEEYCKECGTQKKKRWIGPRMFYVCESCIDPDTVKTTKRVVGAVELAVSSLSRAIDFS